MEIKKMVELLGGLLEIPVTVWGGSTKECEQFERSHCFSPKVQVQLTAGVLEMLCRSLKGHCLYELQDWLGVRLVLFRVEDQTVLTGPFVTSGWKDERGSLVLAGSKLPSTLLIPYKLYYCSYRVTATADVLHCIRVLAGTLLEDKTPMRHQVLRGLREGTGNLMSDTSVMDFEQALQRYEAENEMIRMVQKGDPEGAMKAMAQASAAAADVRLGYIMENRALTSVGIIRTLMRKAAESAGVHPAVVDSISRQYEQRINERGRRAADEVMKEMTEAFCKAVRTVKKENYSPPVRRAVDYIRLNLSLPLRVEQISKAAGVGPDRLGHLFKLETGATLTAYIAARRCAQAAELLLTTSLTVQEISSYVGYLDNNYFVKVFRAQYHMAPTAYRRSNAGTGSLLFPAE